jgi:DNA sulfur modification protein DndD
MISLIELGKLTDLLEAVDSSISLYQEKKKENVIPPTYQPDLIEEILEIKECIVCGKPVDAKSKKHLNDLLRKMQDNVLNVEQISQMGGHLQDAKRDIPSLIENVDRVNKHLKKIEKDLDELTAGVDEERERLVGHDEQEIIDRQIQRGRFEKSIEKTIGELAILKAQLEEDTEDIENKREDLEKELEKVDSHNHHREQLEVVNEALTSLEKTETDIITRMRELVDFSTNKNFKELVWKKKTFEKVVLDENFNLEVLSKSGDPMLAIMSAGERKLLTLGFTLALHEVSGFDPPIVIDTPIANVSGENRRNFSKVLCKIGEEKQSILLFTHDEYTENVSELMEKHLAGKFILEPTSETETKVLVGEA